MLKAVSIEDLKPGMYVNNVLKQKGTMKIKSKGLVKDAAAISNLQGRGVLELEVDYSKSKLPLDFTGESEAAEELKKPATKKPVKSLSDQMSEAQSLHEQAKTIQRGFISKIKKDQKADLDNLHDLSLDIVDSVIESPNALSCLALLNRSDEYLMEHSLNCATLLTMFAKHLNYDSEITEQLSFAGLLMDVGMANVPDDITHKVGKLTKNELDIISTHVDVGLDIVERCGEVSDIVRDIIFNHHERLDGSGYPDNKTEEQLNDYVRMAAIVDCYDAMTSPRPYREAVPATTALKKLLVDKTLDQTLVQKFIQCLGVHPVGSVVKLDNNRLAIVVRANKKDPLKPIVMTFYHLNSGHYSETKMVDLRRSDVEIESSVRPEEFGLNLAKFFREVFISSLSKK